MRAVDMVEAIPARKLSSREVMQAHLKQISRVNARVNSMVTMVPEDQLMAQAAAADEAIANGKWLGALHGLPVAVKDLHDTRGIRTTYGSPLHKSHVPDSIAAWCRGRRRREPSCWARRTYRNSGSARRHSIRFSGLRIILTT